MFVDLESALAAFSNTQSLATAFAAAVEEAPFTRIPDTRAGYRIAITVDEGWTTFEKANQRRVTVAGIAAGGVTGHPEAAPHRAVTMVEAIIRRDSLLNTLLLPAAATLPAGGTLKADIDARRETAWCTRHGSPVMPSAAAAADGAHEVTSLGASWGPGNDIPNEDGPDILHRRSPVADFLFANQALSAEFMVRNHAKLEKRVYTVPEEIDREIARVKIGTMGFQADTLTAEQVKYLGSWSEGT